MTTTETKIWAVGPADAPFRTVSWERACEALEEMLDRSDEIADPPRLLPTADSYANALAHLEAIKRDDPNTSFSILADGRSYWVQRREPEDDDEARRAALAVAEDCDLDDVSEASYGENAYDGPGGEWLVLTDDEADELAAEAIERDLWAFRPEFLESYMPDGIDAECLSAIAENKYEDASPCFARMLGDRLPDLIRDAIGADGRGHFLASYDSEETEAPGPGFVGEGPGIGTSGEREATQFYVYRTN